MNEYTNSANTASGRSRSGLVNALLGAVVMVVFSWIPFAPVVGGALSGSLEAGERDGGRSASRRGVRVGALAGVLATIPAVLVLAFVGSIVTVGWFGTSMSGGMGPRVSLGLPLFAWGFALFVLVVALVYHVGLSALGGWLGAELATRDSRRVGATPPSDGAVDADTDRDTSARRDTDARAAAPSGDDSGVDGDEPGLDGDDDPHASDETAKGRDGQDGRGDRREY